MVGSAQPKDKLGIWGSHDDEMPAPVWQKELKERESQNDSDRGRRESHPLGDR